jgi:hypothetical protein
MGARIAGTTLTWEYDAWAPLFVIIGAIGVLMRTRWGRWMTYPLSVFLLLAVPIGTLLGGFMIWHLTKYRDAFNRWA